MYIDKNKSIYTSKLKKNISSLKPFLSSEKDKKILNIEDKVDIKQNFSLKNENKLFEQNLNPYLNRYLDDILKKYPDKSDKRDKRLLKLIRSSVFYFKELNYIKTLFTKEDKYKKDLDNLAFVVKNREKLIKYLSKKVNTTNKDIFFNTNLIDGKNYKKVVYPEQATIKWIGEKKFIDLDKLNKDDNYFQLLSDSQIQDDIKVMFLSGADFVKTKLDKENKNSLVKDFILNNFKLRLSDINIDNIKSSLLKVSKEDKISYMKDMYNKAELEVRNLLKDNNYTPDELKEFLDLIFQRLNTFSLSLNKNIFDFDKDDERTKDYIDKYGYYIYKHNRIEQFLRENKILLNKNNLLMDLIYANLIFSTKIDKVYQANNINFSKEGIDKALSVLNNLPSSMIIKTHFSKNGFFTVSQLIGTLNSFKTSKSDIRDKLPEVGNRVFFRWAPIETYAFLSILPSKIAFKEIKNKGELKQAEGLGLYVADRFFGSIGYGDFINTVKLKPQARLYNSYDNKLNKDIISYFSKKGINLNVKDIKNLMTNYWADITCYAGKSTGWYIMKNSDTLDEINRDKEKIKKAFSEEILKRKAKLIDSDYIKIYNNVLKPLSYWSLIKNAVNSAQNYLTGDKPDSKITKFIVNLPDGFKEEVKVSVRDFSKDKLNNIKQQVNDFINNLKN